MGACKNNVACIDRVDKGPVPPDRYRMLPAYKYNWNVDVGGPGHLVWFLKQSLLRRLTAKRGGFFLHLGHVSEGCITVDILSGEAIRQWARVDAILNGDADNHMTVTR